MLAVSKEPLWKYLGPHFHCAVEVDAEPPLHFEGAGAALILLRQLKADQRRKPNKVRKTEMGAAAQTE